MTAPITGLPTAAAPASTPAAKEAERLQVLALVQQFEGMLLTEMLRDVRAGDDEDEEASFGFGGSQMNDMMQSEFGAALSRAGGLGMSDMLAKALALQQDPGAREVTPAPVMGPAGLAAAISPRVAALLGQGAPPDDGRLTPGAAAALTLPTAAVSSDFGWRSDPLNGQLKFHKGTDLRLAYGSEVRAAAPGVVVAAGDRPGYGLTVVVDHGAGRETRYAHLSAIDVAPGDPVGGGELIARSGNSGRTTGAHLHFEAREYGRPVDPRLAAASWSDRNTDTTVGESDKSGVRY
ncbi:MAG TPA: peptidoglycan DD-metalloendopeptidase family protein [Vicinamibacterales bacterium]|nr:peptidoglycan DD-metalloendopeptidase family protein [Vicinamibacterales bacterium]